MSVMKKTKVSGLRLIVTSIALVFVAIAGTLGWFAHSTNAFIRGFTMNADSPVGVAEMEGLWYYDHTEPSEAARWKEYNDGHKLNILPGQTLKFRVRFWASPDQTVVMKLTDIGFYHDEEEQGAVSYDDETVVIEKNGVSMGLPKFCNVLKFAKSTSFTGLDSAEKRYLSDGLSFAVIGSDTIPEVILEEGSNASDYSVPSGSVDLNRHEYYYSITYPPTANDNDYMDNRISFKLDVIFS